MALTKEQKEARAANHKAAVEQRKARAANHKGAGEQRAIRAKKTEADKKEYMKAYRAAHKAEKAKQDKARNSDPARKAIALERAKVWQKNNPHNVRVANLNHKALNRGATGKASSDITERRMEQQGGRCAYCHAILEETGYHIDHFYPISKHKIHDDANLLLACPSCNHEKSAQDPLDYIRSKPIDVRERVVSLLLIGLNDL